MIKMKKDKKEKEADDTSSEGSWSTTSDWETESESDNSMLGAAGGLFPRRVIKRDVKIKRVKSDSVKLPVNNVNDPMEFTSKNFKIQSNKFFILEEGKWKEADEQEGHTRFTKLRTDYNQFRFVTLLPCCNFNIIPDPGTVVTTTEPFKHPAAAKSGGASNTTGTGVQRERCYCSPWKRTAVRYLRLTFVSQDVPSVDEMGQSTEEIRSLLNELLQLCRGSKFLEAEPIDSKSYVFWVLPNSQVQAMACLYNKVCNSIPRSQLQVLNASFEKGEQISVPLNISQTMQDLMSWYLEVQPGKETSVPYCNKSCSKGRTKVKVSFTEPPAENDSMCFLSYRKYMVSHAITKTLTKSGYDVEFTKLPPNEQDINTLLVTDMTKRDGQPLKLILGEIVSPYVSTETLDMFQEPMGKIDSSGRIVEYSKKKQKQVQPSNPDLHPYWRTLVMPIFTLPNITFNFDLICRPVVATFYMQLPKYFPNLLESVPRDLYSSYNRLYAIIKVFKERVDQKYYDPAPNHRQTWSGINPVLEVEIEIIQMLFDWPAVVANTVDLRENKENIFTTFQFMIEFNKRFESLYLNHQILVDAPGKHRIQKMYDQLYLLKIIGTLYLDFFELLMLNRDMTINISVKTRQ